LSSLGKGVETEIGKDIVGGRGGGYVNSLSPRLTGGMEYWGRCGAYEIALYHR